MKGIMLGTDQFAMESFACYLHCKVRMGILIFIQNEQIYPVKKSSSFITLGIGGIFKMNTRGTIHMDYPCKDVINN